MLTTRLVQREDNLSISTELVDVRNNLHIWGERYNRKLSDVLSLQEDISRDITNQLRVKLSREQREALTKRPTQNTAACTGGLRYNPMISAAFSSNSGSSLAT